MTKLTFQLFDGNEGSGVVAVNPALVRRLEGSGSSSTLIYFDKDDVVDVRGSLEDVIRSLCASADEIDDEIPL